MCSSDLAYEIDNGDRERLFQTVVRVDNLEQGNGYAKLIYEIEDDEDGLKSIEKDIYFASHESKEVRMVLRNKPESVRLISPYARNVQDPRESLSVPDEIVSEPGEDSIETVTSIPTEIAVIVDDLDPGFSTRKIGAAQTKKIGDASANEKSKKYPRFSGFFPPRNWQEAVADRAFGKYEHTRKIKRAGKRSEEHTPELQSQA